MAGSFEYALETGDPAYDPAVLLKVVLLAYSRGIVSRRAVERLWRGAQGAARTTQVPSERGTQACCRSHMSPLEAALTVALLILPFHFLIQWQLGLESSPRYLRKHGVVIRREEILEHVGETVGQYRGRDIPAAVVFMGMDYRFAGVVHPAYQVKSRELMLAPGLLYITD